MIVKDHIIFDAIPMMIKDHIIFDAIPMIVKDHIIFDAIPMIVKDHIIFDAIPIFSGHPVHVQIQLHILSIDTVSETNMVCRS